MSRALLEEHRRLWAAKPSLARVYRVWFDLLLAEVAGAERVLEVGAGPGFLREYARDRGPASRRWFSLDVLETPWNDVVGDALRLPLRTASVDAVVGLDFLHHLARPAAFFTEAARVLRPGGRLAAVEPWVTPLSYPIYRWLHQEGCRLGLDPWDPFGVGDGGEKDAFAGDAAVVWKLLRDTPEARWSGLGFRPPRSRTLNAFTYLFSLGFRTGSLLPRSLEPLLRAADERLDVLAPVAGLRTLVVWPSSR